MGKPGTAVPGVGCQEKESRRDGTSAARKGDTQIRAVPGGTRHDSAQVTRHLHAGLSYPALLRVEILGISVRARPDRNRSQTWSQPTSTAGNIAPSDTSTKSSSPSGREPHLVHVRMSFDLRFFLGRGGGQTSPGCSVANHGVLGDHVTLIGAALRLGFDLLLGSSEPDLMCRAAIRDTGRLYKHGRFGLHQGFGSD